MAGNYLYLRLVDDEYNDPIVVRYELTWLFCESFK
jgi:hypothetical protein